MSNIYIIKDLLSISKYSSKYGVNYKKIYRYIADELIEFYLIDSVAYLPDREIELLIKNHSKNFIKNNVKSLTLKEISVKILTLNTNSTDNEEDNNVKILTSNQKRILDTSDVKLNAEDLDRKYKLIKLIEEIKQV